MRFIAFAPAQAGLLSPQISHHLFLIKCTHQNIHQAPTGACPKGLSLSEKAASTLPHPQAYHHPRTCPLRSISPKKTPTLPIRPPPPLLHPPSPHLCTLTPIPAAALHTPPRSISLKKPPPPLLHPPSPTSAHSHQYPPPHTPAALHTLAHRPPEKNILTKAIISVSFRTAKYDYDIFYSNIRSLLYTAARTNCFVKNSLSKQMFSNITNPARPVVSATAQDIFLFAKKGKYLRHGKFDKL